MSARRARVVAAYSTVKLLDPASGKWTVAGFYQGAILPAEADPDNVAALVRREYAEWVDEPETEPELVAEPPPEPELPAALGYRPKDHASKADWVDYAVSLRAEGVSEQDARAWAEVKTKAELVAEYGG
jgi:hypothetical protein